MSANTASTNPGQAFVGELAGPLDGSADLRIEKISGDLDGDLVAITKSNNLLEQQETFGGCFARHLANELLCQLPALSHRQPARFRIQTRNQLRHLRGSLEF